MRHWMMKMKRIVDQRALDGEANNGMYWLTSSQKFKMTKDVSESLADRIAVFDMSSLSAVELDEREKSIFHTGLENLYKRIQEYTPKNVHEIYEQIFYDG